MSEPTYTSSTDENFFGAIGRLTISWGHIEAGIDYFVMILHWGLGGRHVERVMPWALQRKIDYIKKCFRKIDGLKPGEPRISGLMDRISSASEYRHDLIHGHVVDHPEGKGEAKLVRLLRQNDEKFNSKHIDVTTESILRHGVAANKLAGELMELVADLARALVEDKNDKPAGEV